LDNFENKKTSEGGAPSENKSGNKPYHKKHHHHHNKNKQNKPAKPAENAEQTKAVAATPPATAESKSQAPQQNKNNRNKNKKHHSGQKRHHEQNRLSAQKEDDAVSVQPAEPKQQNQSKNQNRSRSRDKQHNNEPAELLTEAPINDFDFLPSRSKTDSDFLTANKSDEALLDSMPLDPTIDAIFTEVPKAEPEVIEGPEIVGIRFEHGSKVYYFDPNNIKLSVGEHAIVETAQGLEYGEIVISNRIVSEDQIVAPLRPVIRIATKEDEAHHEDNRRRQNEAFKICLGKIADHGLDMKLVDSQYTFDNTKLIFFFTSAGRVDFRALVKDLASVFRTRIELRQIGIRDEARMVGGFGVCGRKLCCAGFLPNFVQVSIKMAKEQGLSINAAKISGTCGRLMCCLRYEQEAYEREIALMPPANSIVDTPDGRGTVIDIFPISGNVKVKLNDKQDAIPKNYHLSTIKVIRAAESKKQDDGNEE